jgi:hypothetical protein
MAKWTFGLIAAALLGAGLSSGAWADWTDPLLLSAAGSSADDGGIYEMPQPPTAENGTNLGGVNFGLALSYYNHYVYRGVDHSIGIQTGPGLFNLKASTFNLQLDSKLEFNLGKLPHPYIGLFGDVYDADPVSRFQEIRPEYGLDWTVKPFLISAGGNTYIYPNRESLNTAEYYVKVTLDDGFFYHSDKPFFSPYIYYAYDYKRNKGDYIEAGVTHEIPLEDFGLVLTLQADAAYIIGYQQQFVFINNLHDTGFQHFDTGLRASYSLNRLLNVSQRFGQFDVLGTLFYTGKIDGDLTANNVIWGGVGIGFKY